MNLADGLDDDGDSSQVFVEIGVHRQVRESNQQLSMKPEGMEEQQRSDNLDLALPERPQTDVVWETSKLIILSRSAEKWQSQDQFEMWLSLALVA